MAQERICATSTAVERTAAARGMRTSIQTIELRTINMISFQSAQDILSELGRRGKEVQDTNNLLVGAESVKALNMVSLYGSAMTRGNCFISYSFLTPLKQASWFGRGSISVAM